MNFGLQVCLDYFYSVSTHFGIALELFKCIVYSSCLSLHVFNNFL